MANEWKKKNAISMNERIKQRMKEKERRKKTIIFIIYFIKQRKEWNINERNKQIEWKRKKEELEKWMKNRNID